MRSFVFANQKGLLNFKESFFESGLYKNCGHALFIFLYLRAKN